MTMLVGPDGMQAGWLESPKGKLFCCYHEPRGERRRAAAVLMCDPFGSDRMNLHLSYRALALELSRRGFPVLRVDYPGTCDSSGYPRQSARLDTWLDSLGFAADWLCQASGKQELAAFGALLGGTLALWLCSRRDDIGALALWGCHRSGRAFVREAQAFAGMTQANREGRRPPDCQPGDLEAVGFLLTRDFADDLRALDVARLARLCASRVALFARDKGNAEQRLVEELRALGAEVCPPPPAIVDIAELEVDKARPPDALIAQMAGFFDGAYPPSCAPAEPPRSEARARLRSSVTVLGPTGIELTEEVFRCGGDGGVLAIATEPPGAPRAPGVLLVNGGANHRSGINRNFTEWARKWAEQGLLVVRMDIRGLGDGVPNRPEDVAVLYRDETRRDVRDVMDAASRAYGIERFAVGGVCAGGYQAFHTALEDARITGLFMVNPLRFAKEQERTGDERPELDYAPLSHYASAMFNRDNWTRVARGVVDIKGVARSVGSRLAQRARQRLEATSARMQNRPLPGATWLARAMVGLTERGCRVLVVFNAEEWIRGRFDEELHADRARLLANGFAVETVDQTDHILTPLWSQHQVGALLGRYLLDWSQGAIRTSWPAAPPDAPAT